MARLIFLPLFLFSVVYGLTCYSGIYKSIDGDLKIDSRTSIECTRFAKSCLKAKIELTGETGHNVTAIQFGCDEHKLCDDPKAENITKTTCKEPSDLWVGDACCCKTDECNDDFDVPTVPPVPTPCSTQQPPKPKSSAYSILVSLMPTAFMAILINA